jgi:chromosome segregation ATPase
MGFLDWLLGEDEKEPIQISLENIPEEIKERRAEKLDELEDKSDNFRKRISDSVGGLDEALDEIEDFRDEKGRKAVNDISENIVDDRREIIENFSLTDDPEENLEALESFLSNFQSLKRKEAAVLEITSLQDKLAKQLTELEDTRKEMNEFLEQEYSLKKKQQQIENKMEKIEQIESDTEELKQEKASIDIDEIKEEIEEKENKLEDFRESEQMQEYQELQKKLEEKQEEIEDINGNIRSDLSVIQRGLKKLVYSAENEDIKVGDIEVLKALRDQNSERALEEPERVEEAISEVSDFRNDFEALQKDKVEESLDSLQRISEKADRIRNLEEDISDLRETLDESDADTKLESYREEVERKEQKLKEKKSRIEDISSEMADKEQELSELKEEVIGLAEEVLDREIRAD